MQRGGRVVQGGVGPVRFRIHARLWRPFVMVTFGLRGHHIHGFKLGAY